MALLINYDILLSVVILLTTFTSVLVCYYEFEDNFINKIFTQKVTVTNNNNNFSY